MNPETIDHAITAAVFGLPIALSALYAFAMIRYESRKGGAK